MFFIGGKNETNTQLEQPFYLLTKTWKYCGSVFGTEVAECVQSIPGNVICIFSGLITLLFPNHYG